MKHMAHKVVHGEPEKKMKLLIETPHPRWRKRSSVFSIRKDDLDVLTFLGDLSRLFSFK